MVWCGAGQVENRGHVEADAGTAGGGAPAPGDAGVNKCEGGVASAYFEKPKLEASQSR